MDHVDKPYKVGLFSTSYNDRKGLQSYIMLVFGPLLDFALSVVV